MSSAAANQSDIPFIPTLTDVVETAGPQESHQSPDGAVASLAEDGPRPEGQAGAPALQEVAEARRILSDEFEEQIVHRVLQRVDTSLADWVSEAISSVIEQQTRSLLPRLREEVEFAVRKSVYEAVVDELSEIAAKNQL